jgi:hypothetical protein
MRYPVPARTGTSTALVALPTSAMPVRPKIRRNLFEGDAAIIELRYRLAVTRGSIVPAPRLAASAPAYGGSTFRSVTGYVSAVLVAAATAGAGGYVAGHIKQAIKTDRLVPSSVATARPVPLLPVVTHVTAPIGASEPASLRAIAIDTAPAHRAPDLPLPTAQRLVPLQQLWDSVARMKLGAELMAAGDIAAARTMFERVADAGDAAGAFALAETYDPAVLRAMPLRGGITPDAGLARRWYEKARDMVSSSAPERLARLRRTAKR